jgi:hypothetical protein
MLQIAAAQGQALNARRLVSDMGRMLGLENPDEYFVDTEPLNLSGMGGGPGAAAGGLGPGLSEPESRPQGPQSQGMTQTRQPTEAA